ncbi:PD-(D/E)XK nuclease family protein [Leptolyngbya sp. PCC 6406]|uniref:PD-(D/E)XK nuclease family protein n=1 Tax=Leptolyngbya sp. PCC 6406 TaxID=1173264 RepID=UPI0002ACCB6C|nr:PD-(D/E)XK nuclease family protein [Leptolyngbya sp. PCC 6406]
MRLSQGHLTLLDYCPRRFQHTVLDSLMVPTNPDLLAGQRWGNRFHLMMQQREMGLPVEPVLAEDPELQAAVTALAAADPSLFEHHERFRQSEHGRALVLNGYWFTVIYDLLRLWDGQGEIIDWKTYLNPRNLNFLSRDWQTRLYCYVLVETTDLSPDQVTMTYWFVRTRDPVTQEQQPQRVQIPYSAQRHAQTHIDLLRLTDYLTQAMATSNPLPQIPETQVEKCAHCPFMMRCQRGSARGDETPELPPLEAIPEVVL